MYPTPRGREYRAPAGFLPPDVAPGEAIVVFLQPIRQYDSHAVIYEDGKFIGLVMDRTYFIQRATPAAHRYMATPNAAGLSWVETHAGTAAELEQAYLPKWLSKAEQPTPYPDDGVPPSAL